MVRSGRSAPMVKTIMVPEAWSKATTDLPKPWADMYAYCNSIMEPWDGPAALAMTDGRWVCGGLDRNGLVGACHRSDCVHNDKLECHASGVRV